MKFTQLATLVASAQAFDITAPATELPDITAALDDAMAKVDMMTAIDDAFAHVEMLSAIDEAFAHVETKS